jgi:filamentous hemagglutinin family protein
MRRDLTSKNLLRRTQLGFAFCTLWVTVAGLSGVLPAVSAADSPNEHVSVRQAAVQAVSPTMPSPVPTNGATILNWNSFSFLTTGAVRFIQPSEYSIALNRVVGWDQSVVLGQLPSESQSVLINPHRNLLRKPVQTNTGEFLATTLQLHPEGALGDRDRSEQDLLKGLKAVVNSSTVHVSEHGYVALVAPGVETEGVIIANVAPARSDSEQAVSLDLMSDGLIRYAISQKTLSHVTGLNGKALVNAISNSKSTEGAAGKVILSARSAGDILSAVVNTGNVSRAHRLVNRGGVVRLESEGPDLVLVAETGDTSGTAVDRRSSQTSAIASLDSLADPAHIDMPKRSGGAIALPIGNNQKLIRAATSSRPADSPELEANKPSKGESGKVGPGRLSPQSQQTQSQTTNLPPSESGQSKTKSGSSSASVGTESALKAAASPNGEIGKRPDLKPSHKVRQGKPQSMASDSAEWRQPKWNFLADWDESTAQKSVNGQGMNPATPQSTR